MASAVIDDFRITSVLGRSFIVLLNNFGSFMALGLIVMSPILLLGLAQPGTVVVGDGAPTDGSAVHAFGAFEVLAGVMILVLAYLLQAAVVYGTFKELRGRRAHLADCLGKGLPRVVPALFVALLLTIANGLGLLAFAIPTLIVMTVFYVAVPVAVIERPGILSSLGRSAGLTEGYRWAVFGLVFIVGTLSWLSIVLLSFVVGSLVDTAPNAQSMMMPCALVLYLHQVGIGCVSAVLSAVAYHDLRAVQEKISVDQMAPGLA